MGDSSVLKAHISLTNMVPLQCLASILVLSHNFKGFKLAPLNVTFVIVTNDLLGLFF